MGILKTISPVFEVKYLQRAHGLSISAWTTLKINMGRKSSAPSITSLSCSLSCSLEISRAASTIALNLTQGNVLIPTPFFRISATDCQFDGLILLLGIRKRRCGRFLSSCFGSSETHVVRDFCLQKSHSTVGASYLDFEVAFDVFVAPAIDKEPRYDTS